MLLRKTNNKAEGTKEQKKGKIIKQPKIKQTEDDETQNTNNDETQNTNNNKTLYEKKKKGE